MPYLAIFETLSPTKVETPQDVKNLISIFTTLEEEDKIKYQFFGSWHYTVKGGAFVRELKIQIIKVGFQSKLTNRNRDDFGSFLLQNY